MHFYNAIQAAKYIGCDPKTVRRMLKRGELTGERTERGWLAIPGGQVEYAKIKWEEEQAKFARPWLSKESLPEQPREGMDIIGRVEALEQKVAELEKALSNAPLHVPIQPIPPSTSTDIPPKSQPTVRNVDTSSPLPDDLLSARDFAAKIGIEYTILDGYARRGIRGERMDVTEVPHPTRKGYSNRYFTPTQQEQAIVLLRKHGKLS